MERAGGRSFVWYPGVLAASLVGAYVGYLFTVLLYIVVGEVLFYFISLCFMALLAALCAVFAGDALAGRGLRVRLWSVVGVGQAAAVLAALANMAFADAVGLSALGLGRQMPVNAVAIAVVCGVAAWGSRRMPTASSAGAKDGRSAVLLVALALVLIVAAMLIYESLNPPGG